MSQTKVQLVNDVSGNSGFGLSSATGVVHLHKASSDSIEGLKITNSTTGSGLTDGLSIGLQSDEDVFIHNYENTSMLFGTNDTNRLAITSAGNIGVSTTSPYAQTDVSGTALTPVVDLKGVTQNNTSGVLQLTRKDHPNQGSCIYSSGDDAGLTMRNTDGNGMGFYNGTTLALRVDSVGKFTAIGNKPNANAFSLQNSATSNPEGLYMNFTGAAPNTQSRHFLKCADNVGDRAVIDSNGNLRNENNSYGGFSDVTLKENIVDAGSQWDDIKNVKVRVFNFKKDDASEKRIGVVAQEIETVCPKLVDITYDKDEDGNLLETGVKSVKYSVLYMKAIKALQEAITKIETLETEVAALKAA